MQCDPHFKTAVPCEMLLKAKPTCVGLFLPLVSVIKHILCMEKVPDLNAWHCLALLGNAPAWNHRELL